MCWGRVGAKGEGVVETKLLGMPMLLFGGCMQTFQLVQEALPCA